MSEGDLVTDAEKHFGYSPMRCTKPVSSASLKGFNTSSLGKLSPQCS